MGTYWLELQGEDLYALLDALGFMLGEGMATKNAATVNDALIKAFPEFAKKHGFSLSENY